MANDGNERGCIKYWRYIQTIDIKLVVAMIITNHFHIFQGAGSGPESSTCKRRCSPSYISVRLSPPTSLYYLILISTINHTLIVFANLANWIPSKHYQIPLNHHQIPLNQHWIRLSHHSHQHWILLKDIKSHMIIALQAFASDPPLCLPGQPSLWWKSPFFGEPWDDNGIHVSLQGFTGKTHENSDFHGEFKQG